MAGVLRTTVAAAAAAAAAAPAVMVVTAVIIEEEAVGMGSGLPLTEIAVEGMQDAATALALTPMISTRTAAAAAAAVSTVAPGAARGQGAVEWGRPHLLLQALSL